MFIRIKGLKFARSFGGKGKVCIFALRNLHPGNRAGREGRGGVRCFERRIGSDGRVARQRSAKPCTAVRVRFRPHRNRVVDVYNAVFFLFCHTFVIQQLD